ncbi:hypothetical protein AMS68_006016 [Peltaster fructicola]|uniref:Uncharacterized protein n=1 Tax=Peltaster fructicola TaxID=286661 RepID=A0A6H0Y0V7_9PEZI|nr:hypothetical protein AMS68_006016 [Peltaster fructicola]
MSQFQNNFYDMVDYHDEQLAHYGFHTTRSIDDLPVRTPPPVYEQNGFKTVESVQYQPYRDPLRSAHTVLRPPTYVERVESDDDHSKLNPGLPITVLNLQHIELAESEEPKQSLLQRLLKRRTSVDSNTRSAKRVKIESRDEPGFRKNMIKRARDLAAIVAATAQERQQYEEHIKHTFEEKVEEQRREHPEQRPVYQQAYLVEKQKIIFPGTAYEDLGPQHYPVLVEEHNAEVRLHAGLQADYQNRCRMSMALGMELPKPPLPAQGPALQLNSVERQEARMGAFETNGRMPEEEHQLSAAEKVAMGISKLLDPLKKNQMNGEMDFVDAAPQGMLDTCNKCHEPTQTYLIDGVCQLCHAKLRGH